MEGHPPHRSDSRGALRIDWAAPILIGTIPVLTAVVVRLGPEAQPVGPDSALSAQSVGEAISEPTDRIVVAMWIVLTGLVTALIARRTPMSAPSAPARWWQRHALWATVPGVALITAGLLYSRDALDIASRIPPIDLIGGAAIAAVLVLAAAYAVRGRTAATIVQIGIAAGLYVPVLIQFPDRLGDLFHARVAFGDLLAVAAGATPLHDFFPLYGMLLGYPIAPIVAIFPASADAIVTYWVILLQAVTLVTAIALVAWAGGRRYIGAAALIVPALAMSGGPPGIGPFTYFPVNPIRTVLPVLAIAAACWALSGSRRARGMAGRGAAGAVAGIAALNNPDFGLGVVLVILAVSVATAMNGRRVRALAVTFSGAIAPFVLWAVATALAGVPSDWSRYLMFQTLFGPEGYMSIPMTAVGWHVGAVVLFGAAFAIGVALLVRTRGQAESRLARQGLLLTLVGGWSLLTLPYFMGRSLAPTLTGGYALQVCWAAAALMPLVVVGLRRSRMAGLPARSQAGTFSVVAGVVMLAVVSVGILRASPLDAWSRETHPAMNLVGDQLPGALESTPPAVQAAASRGQVTQIIGIPPLTAITTGIPSASAFSQPDQSSVAPALARAQCEVLADSDSDYVVVPSSVVPALEEQASCNVLDFSGVVLFGTPEAPATQPPFAAIPRRPAKP